MWQGPRSLGTGIMPSGPIAPPVLVQTGPYILVGAASYFLKDAVVICFFDLLVLPEFSKPEASFMKLYF